MTFFTGQPLFGKDSSPHYTSKILGFFGTCGLWLVFLICMIFIKPADKAPKYKEVQIVLESTPKVQEDKKAVDPVKTADSKAAVTESIPEPVKKTPQVEKTAPASSKKTPAKKSPAPVAKKTAATAPVEEDIWDDFEYAVDPMEAFAQQTATTQKQDVDWDAMFSEESTTTQASVSGGKVVGGNEFSGRVGTASGSANTGVKSSEVGGGGSSESLEASRATSTALGDILNTRFEGTSSDALESATTVQAAKDGNGKVFIKMSNGRSRALIKPAEPGIKLSKEAEATIDGSKSVKIRFMVTKTGNVPSTQISITPEAILTDIVKQEIRAQISQWLFEADNYDAFAEFEYNIVKK